MHNDTSVLLSCPPSNRMSSPLLNPALTLCGALALELSEPASNIHPLPRDLAGTLAQLLAHDLAEFDARAKQLSMSTVGAHYDPVELLCPGWPILAELDQLGARAPGQDRARVLAFGASAGQLPGKLQPAEQHLGGLLRVIPFVLRGEADMVAMLGARLEHELIEYGMAGAQTALMAQDAFVAKVEHARYLTLHDLCAMTALQYEHAGLAPLWPLIETALLSPEHELWLDTPPEPLLGWRNRRAYMAEFTDNEWSARYAPNLTTSENKRLQKHFQARQRQFVSVLAAHSITVSKVAFSDLDR